MGVRTVLGVGLQVLVALVVVSLLAGQVLGQPILLSFVTTGSMEPTLEPGDGFVAIPSELAGEIGEGDVVVFEAQEIQGGGLTTHRIVDESDRGFVTRGDANPFTDQDSDEPPVQEAEIVAVAWQPGGNVVAIPALGTAVMGIQSVLESLQVRLAQLFGTRTLLGTQGLAYLLFATSVLLYGVAAWREDDRKRDRTRGRDTGTDARLWVVGLTLLVVVGATAAMVVPAGTQEFGIVSAEFESDRPDVIRQGTSESLTYVAGNTGVVPTVVFLEPENDEIAVDRDRIELPGRSTANATVTITAPPETGHYRFFLTEHRYLELLPVSVIETLYDVHPWLPIVVIDAIVAVPFYLLGTVLLGTGRIRSQARDRPSALRRWLSRLTG